MAKFDVETAYRNIAVHPDDRYLLGLKWRDHYYVDVALPFGLRSAPFSSVADMVEWILRHAHNVSDLMHYLDDFITAGPPDSSQCEDNMAKSLAASRVLGLPLHPDKSYRSDLLPAGTRHQIGLHGSGRLPSRR